MIKIDWRMAPEWADGHGLISWQGFTEVWISADQYAVVGREGGPYPWGGGTGDTRHNHTRSQVEYITPRPARWDGEGLPAVGAELEAGFACEDFKIWHAGVCMAVGICPEGREEYCVVQFGEKLAQYGAEGRRMRPVRTPEQIAKEERDSLCHEAQFTLPNRMVTNREIIEHTYDLMTKAGYRKQEAS